MSVLSLLAAAPSTTGGVQLFPFADYWWFYAGFLALVGVLLALDLGVFHRHAHTVSIKEASLWSVVWVTLALAFNYGLYRYLLHHLPQDPRLAALPGFDPARTAWEVALQFLAGYVVEYSLSIDNIFVFVVVLNYFKIPSEYQHRVLFFGILGALVFRAIFITIGAALIQYNWVVILFGLFLIFTGFRMMIAKEEGVEPEENAAIQLFKKRMPVTHDLHGQNFFVTLDGRKHATPLFIAVLFLEMTDIVFAVDSVPAIFALTSEPLIVFTSNIFAILGLRNLYFMLRGAIDKFHLLKYGLGIVLIFVGCKMTFLGRFFEGGHVPIELSLGIILGVIALSILASLIFPQGPHDPDVPPLPMPIGHEAMTHDVHKKTSGEKKETKS
jgi:tellurite resistance protein TerC